jgi:hypothetical protein
MNSRNTTTYLVRCTVHVIRRDYCISPHLQVVAEFYALAVCGLGLCIYFWWYFTRLITVWYGASVENVPSLPQSPCHSTITCPICMPQYHNLPSRHATVSSPAQSPCCSTINCPVCMPPYRHLPSVHDTIPSPAQCVCHSTTTCPAGMLQYHHLPSLRAIVPSPAQCVCHRTVTCPVCMTPYHHLPSVYDTVP